MTFHRITFSEHDGRLWLGVTLLVWVADFSRCIGRPERDNGFLPALFVRRWSTEDLVLWFVVLCPLQLPFGSGNVMRQLSNLAFLALLFKSLFHLHVDSEDPA